MFRWDEAASYFKKSLQVEPDQPAVRSLVAFLQETHGL
jgi:hypothetical protein